MMMIADMKNATKPFSEISDQLDALGERFAKEHNLGLKVVPADWKTYGRSAGPRRNEQMARMAGTLIAFWDGKSRGTKNMIDTVKRLGLRVKTVTI